MYPGLEYQPEHLAIFGLSYVAPWIMFFTIGSPNLPRRSLMAAIGAGSAVPVVLALSVKYGGTSIALTGSVVVNSLIVPYSMVAVAAWIAARVIYRLGAAVTKARKQESAGRSRSIDLM